MQIADERGSSLPLMLGFILLFLYFCVITTNASSAFLFRQHLQSNADQAAITRFQNGERTNGETFELELCREWQVPVKAIGLPTTQRICARSAAR